MARAFGGANKMFGSFPFVPPSTLCSPHWQSTCHYIVNHYVKILHVRLGVANNMHPLSWGGGHKQKRSKCLFIGRNLFLVSHIICQLFDYDLGICQKIHNKQHFFLQRKNNFIVSWVWSQLLIPIFLMHLPRIYYSDDFRCLVVICWWRCCSSCLKKYNFSDNNK